MSEELQNTDQAVNLEEPKATASQKAEGKTYSQEDVNNIVTKESRKATEKLLKDLGVEDFDSAKDGLSKLKAWQDEQKTEAEKKDEAYNQITEERNKLAEVNKRLEANNTALVKGVLGDCVEDVVALAERLVSDDVTIDQAIDKVLDKYPQFKTAKDETPKFMVSGNPNVGGEKKRDPFQAVLDEYK